MLAAVRIQCDPRIINVVSPNDGRASSGIGGKSNNVHTSQTLRSDHAVMLSNVRRVVTTTIFRGFIANNWKLLIDICKSTSNVPKFTWVFRGTKKQKKIQIMNYKYTLFTINYKDNFTDIWCISVSRKRGQQPCNMTSLWHWRKEYIIFIILQKISSPC